jgi:hypothetical protein
LIVPRPGQPFRRRQREFASPARARLRECARERVLGADVNIEIEAYDEWNTVGCARRYGRFSHQWLPCNAARLACGYPGGSQEGFFAANQCRRVCNDWPLVAALLLVLPLIVTRAMNHAAIGEIIKYNGTLERYAGDGVMVVFNDPVPVENLALQAVLMALELRDALGALTATRSRLGHEIGCRMRYALGPILMPAPTSLSLLACS